jgi:protein SCO1/2
MRLVLAALALCLGCQAAEANLSRADLSRVAASPPPNAHLDLSLTARDITGRQRSLGAILGRLPGFVVPVDYTCTNLCGADLTLLVAAIGRAGISPSDYRLVVLGIDPKDRPADAKAMEDAQIPPELRPATVFLLPDTETIARATTALGFRYVYDAAADQFAHPAAVYLVGADGEVRATLSPFALTAADLSAALAATHPLGLIERVRLLCYGYDPATGTYSGRVVLLLRLGGVATVLLLAGGVTLLSLARRRAG